MLPVKMELFHVVLVVVQMTRGDLASASLTVGVRHSIILWYLDTILPVHPIEVILEAAYGSR